MHYFYISIHDLTIRVKVLSQRKNLSPFIVSMYVSFTNITEKKGFDPGMGRMFYVLPNIVRRHIEKQTDFIRY